MAEDESRLCAPSYRFRIAPPPPEYPVGKHPLQPDDRVVVQDQGIAVRPGDLAIGPDRLEGQGNRPAFDSLGHPDDPSIGHYDRIARCHQGQPGIPSIEEPWLTRASL